MRTVEEEKEAAKEMAETYNYGPEWVQMKKEIAAAREEARRRGDKYRY